MRDRTLASLSSSVARGWVGALLLLAAACASAPPAPERLAGPSASAAIPKPAAAQESTSREPPEGYLELRVEDVIATPHGGPAVILVDAEKSLLVPIFVGGSEALSIDLRNNKRRYARPLTHDLLDAVLDKLGGKLVRVQIDGVREETFVGSIYVERGGQIMELDARPSDAIALALGRGAPILVHKSVVLKAAIKRGDLPPPGERPRPPPDPEGERRNL